jgi:hypothetical protein
MVDADARWGRLSWSSKRALRWARAMARLRTSAATGIERVGDADLLMGILLTHPGRSPAQVLFEHFGLTGRQMLPKGYPMVDVKVLAEEAPDIPDELPPLEPEAEMVLEAADQLAAQTGDVTHLRMLFAALIANPNSNPTAAEIQRRLSGVGVDAGELTRAYLDYVSGEEGTKQALGNWLQERYPEAQRPVMIPDYKADLDTSGPGAEDLLGIQPEVDAFAYLLASRGLVPPLAVGLFGDWGSGKSFFMRSVRRRIEEITAADRVRDVPQSQLPYWKDVVQVEFNAWQYVAGDLWASLVEHIFRHLATARSQDASLLAQRQRRVFDRLTTLAQEQAIARHQREALATDLAEKRKDARAKRQHRDDQLAKLEDARQKAFRERLGDEARAELANLLPAATGPQGLAPAEDLLTQLIETRRQLGRGTALLGPFWSSGPGLWLALAAVVVVPLVPWLLQRAGGAGPAQAAGALAAACAYAAGMLRAANGWLRGRLERLDAVRQEVENAIAKVQREADQQVEEAQRAADQAEQDLAVAVREEQAIATEVERLNAELATITPTRVLSDFLSERARADDYRRHLGIAALIRNDFEQLSDLIRSHNSDVLEGKAEEDLGMNRIILYIDDLDRCPAKKVIEVLQAVHLLLAFDLFVVVVAVDSRWLSNSLISEHPSLVGTVGDRSATPRDYLEKIFQVPFWIQPLAEGDRRHLVHGLLERNLLRRPASATTATTDVPAPDPLTVNREEEQVIYAMLRAPGRPHAATETLAITRQELDFFDELAPLLGETPRTVKRLVNVYQLLTAMPGVRTNGQQQPGETLIVAFLVAMNGGLPRLAPRLFQLARQSPAATLAELVEKMEPSIALDQQRRLHDWLETRQPWRDLAASRLLTHLALVERVGFRDPPDEASTITLLPDVEPVQPGGRSPSPL